ncbi:hypothetical protein U879_15310 [Defluviimonas sp. 20V17]|nr:hypothetical protein U879_15310 [Defluviimonas sp. 20V17]
MASKSAPPLRGVRALLGRKVANIMPPDGKFFNNYLKQKYFFVIF